MPSPPSLFTHLNTQDKTYEVVNVIDDYEPAAGQAHSLDTEMDFDRIAVKMRTERARGTRTQWHGVVVGWIDCTVGNKQGQKLRSLLNRMEGSYCACVIGEWQGEAVHERRIRVKLFSRISVCVSYM